jgi:hypothetical protein
MIRHFTSVVAAALSIGVIGCGVSADDQDVGGGLGETEQASVGDSACTTVSPLVSPDGTSKAIQPDPHCSITFTGATSPDTSYDWSPNACGQTYVAQITGTAGRAFSFGISDAGPALDATTCPLVGVVGAAHSLAVSDGLWHLIGKTVWHGEWVSGPLFTFCNFVKDPGQSDIPSATGTGSRNYSRVRVEGVSVGFIFKRRVTVGISYGPGPC